METKTLDNLKDLHSKLEVVFKAENEAKGYYNCQNQVFHCFLLLEVFNLS